MVQIKSIHDKNLNTMKNLLSLLSELAVRLQSESPKLFKKLQWISGILTVLITLILSFNEFAEIGLGTIIIYKGINLPEFLLMINTLLVGAFGISKLPVEDNTVITELKKQA